MDLPTCPSCGQSVLDEDAADCPFCGASMSGKPASKPSSPAPKKSSGASPPPVRKQKGGSAPPVRRGATAVAEQEDAPIEADEEAKAKAIPVRLKKVKGLVLRVKCPMCESEGWVPAKAAGRDVRCVNKQCLVPIYTAPELPKKEEDKGPEKKSVPWTIVVTALVAVGGAIGAWVYFGSIESPDEIDGKFTLDPVECDTPECRKPDDGGPVLPVEEGPTVAEIREEILELMIINAEGSAQKEKPPSRQRTAASHARLGDRAGAREQIKSLRGLGRYAPVYEIDAVAEIGWTNLRNGRDTEAKAAAEELKDISESPYTGRAETLAFANRIALLHAVGRSDLADGSSVPADRHARGAWVQRLAEVSRSFDVDFEMDHASFLDPADLGAQMVTLQFADRDRWDEAIRYADQSLDGAARVESLVLIAELLAARNPELADAHIARAVGLLDVPEAALAHARVAVRHLTGGRAAPAKASLAKATELLPETAPSPAKLPSAKAIYEKTFRYERPFATLAAAEVARVTAIEAALTAGDTSAAWTAYERALNVASGETPPANVTARRMTEAEGPTRELVDELKEQVNVATDELAITKVLPEYRLNLKEVDAAARRVLEARRAIVIDAARRGMAADVWNLVDSGAAGEPATAFTNSPVIHVLNEELEGDAKTEIADLVEKRRNAVEVGLVSPETVLREESNLAKLGKVIGENGARAADLLFLRLASRIERDKGREAAIEFLLGNEHDFVVRAAAARLIEARAAKETEFDIAWERLKDSEQAKELVGLDFVSAAEGLLLATENATDPPPTEDGEGDGDGRDGDAEDAEPNVTDPATASTTGAN